MSQQRTGAALDIPISHSVRLIQGDCVITITAERKSGGIVRLRVDAPQDVEIQRPGQQRHLPAQRG